MPLFKNEADKINYTTLTFLELESFTLHLECKGKQQREKKGHEIKNYF